jgi:hypothetical protein
MQLVLVDRSLDRQHAFQHTYHRLWSTHMHVRVPTIFCIVHGEPSLPTCIFNQGLSLDLPGAHQSLLWVLNPNDPLGVTSAGNWAGPDQPGPSPSCFVPNGFGPAKPKRFFGRAVPAQSIKTVVQPGPKPRRVFFGPCQHKPGPYIWPHKIKILQPYKVHSLLN